MQTNTYQGLQIINKKQSITTDELVIEAPLQININNESYTVVMRTPGNDQDLVLGLLYAEDIYKNSLPIPFKIIEEKFNIPSIINVTIASNHLGKGYLNKRTLLSWRNLLKRIKLEPFLKNRSIFKGLEMVFAVLDCFHALTTSF